MRHCSLVLLLCGGCTPTYDAQYWRSYEQERLADNELRTDRDPADAPFTNADLIRNFREIMFYDEYIRVDERYVPGRAPRPLEKLSGPVRYAIYGATPEDLGQIDTFLGIARRATGLEFVQRKSEDEDVDVMLLIADAEGRQTFADDLEATGGSGRFIHDLRHDLGDAVCAAYSFQTDEPDRPVFTIIVIPDEVSGLLRRSCIEEELGQALGPSADFDQARPSIFNDDEEFALLTVHDAFLLRILYDDRLIHGMDEKTAMPIVRRIVRELRPDDHSPIKDGAQDAVKPPG